MILWKHEESSLTIHFLWEYATAAMYLFRKHERCPVKTGHGR